MQKIEKPDQKTWFIAYTGSNPPHSYGMVETIQEMKTGFKDIEIFTNNLDFLRRCEELNIVVEEDYDSN